MFNKLRQIPGRMGQKTKLAGQMLKIQKQLGADIIFTFDECTSPLAGYDYTKKAMERTHRWAKRCLKEFSPNPNPNLSTYEVDRLEQALFGIVQGGEYRDLREE